MAISVNNIILHGASGKLGNVVFRKLHGKLVICKAPAPSSVPPSEKQLQGRERFKAAQQYAAKVIETPHLRAIYAARAKGARKVYHMALQDACHAPQILEVAAGPQIVMRVRDNFRVQAVQVVILTAEGDVWEEGPATQKTNKFDWMYMVRKTPPEEMQLHIIATDLPGNTATKVLPLPPASFTSPKGHFK
ncbi:hypothetical protein [Chitinophaga sp.]|uniref:hypothetical protein n=1 Tax=Chitinophaga sp. TaxID=1869181 RepID=UPI0031D8A904